MPKVGRPKKEKRMKSFIEKISAKHKNKYNRLYLKYVKLGVIGNEEAKEMKGLKRKNYKEYCERINEIKNKKK